MTSFDSEKPPLSPQYHSGEVSCGSESEQVVFASADSEQLAKRVMVLQREKEDWMQKYFALLAEKEREEVRVAGELSSLEADVQDLSLRAFDLTAEKQDLTDTVSSLMAENARLQSDMASQQRRWDDEMKALKRALAREREACAVELSAIGEQFVRVRDQFECYKRRLSVDSPTKSRRQRDFKLSLSQPLKKPSRAASTDRGRLEHQRRSSSKSLKAKK